MAEYVFGIGDKSKDLLNRVLDATTNRKKYPVKFRPLIDRLQEIVLDIHCFALDANSIKADTQKRKDCRYDLQTQVVSCCDKFLSLTEYSLHAKLISASTCDTWSGLATDIKYMTLSWRSKGY